MASEKRSENLGIFIKLTPEEDELVKAAVKDIAPNMPLAQFGRTALFYFLHRAERDGFATMLAEILGAS